MAGLTDNQRARLIELVSPPFWAFYNSASVPAESRLDLANLATIPADDNGLKLLAAEILEVVCLYGNLASGASSEGQTTELKAGPLSIKESVRTSDKTGSLTGSAACDRAARLRREAGGAGYRLGAFAIPRAGAGRQGARPEPVFNVTKAGEEPGYCLTERQALK